MKILVVDDEQRFGALICRSLRKLGHQPLLALHPEDALGLLEANPDLDAVISDLDMPVMSGIELARAIHARRDDVPIGFCTGSSPGSRVMSEAAAIGKVLTAPWSLGDLGGLVGHLQRRRARGSAPRRSTRVQLGSWDEVGRLCDRRERGPVRLATQGTAADDGPVDVTLALPDGFALTVDGEVVARKMLPDGDALELIVELTGLSPELTVRLRALAAPMRRSAPPPESIPELSRARAQLERVAAGTPLPDIEEWREEGWERELARAAGGMRVSELLLSNERLKAQIEALAAKMRPRGEPDDEPA
jgi:CheY-like chemotaxis protein